MQLHVGIGAGDLFEEAQELLVTMPGLAGRGDLPGGDLQRGEQGGGAVPDVVMGAPLGQPRLHRQHRRGAVQRLDLGLRAPAIGQPYAQPLSDSQMLRIVSSLPVVR
jgi:hypothetical protein